MTDLQDFLGRGWRFPPTFDKGIAGVEMLEGKEDIESSLEVLLTTNIGARVMQPRYGCNLEPLIFEPLNVTLKAYMKDLIETSILFFEPRIILNDIYLEEAALEGIIQITIDYTITATNSRYNFVYPFSKEEASFLLEGR